MWLQLTGELPDWGSNGNMASLADVDVSKNFLQGPAPGPWEG